MDSTSGKVVSFSAKERVMCFPLNVESLKSLLGYPKQRNMSTVILAQMEKGDEVGAMRSCSSTVR